MQNYVFVLDTNKQPQNPVRPAEARLLLNQGRAAVYKRYPFTIILKEAGTIEPKPITLKVDPGSKTTGMALVQDRKVIFAAELTHRAQAIKNALDKRRVIRHGRRARNTRYRQPRFDNRSKIKGWLAPSLKSRVDNLQTWFTRFFKLAPVTSISMELVRFDMQLMQNAEISGIEYQQGELQGYEVREYLLEKFNRECSYCGKQDVPLEIEHIMPKSRGGSNRVSNLCLACHECNIKKGTRTAIEFGYPEVQALAKKPLKDAAAVNATRWATLDMFKATGLLVEVGTGGCTKHNRSRHSYPKEHWIDAACVGKSGEDVKLCSTLRPLLIKAVGRQSRQMCRPDKYGFPRTAAKQSRVVKGFQTGDLVRAIVSQGKYKGTHQGRIRIRTTGNFQINGIDINWKYCRTLHKSDGYAYQCVPLVTEGKA